MPIWQFINMGGIVLKERNLGRVTDPMIRTRHLGKSPQNLVYRIGKER